MQGEVIRKYDSHTKINKQADKVKKQSKETIGRSGRPETNHDNPFDNFKSQGVSFATRGFSRYPGFLIRISRVNAISDEDEDNMIIDLEHFILLSRARSLIQ